MEIGSQETTMHSLSQIPEKKERSEVGAEEALASILSLKSFEPALHENKLGEREQGEPPGIPNMHAEISLFPQKSSRNLLIVDKGNPSMDGLLFRMAGKFSSFKKYGHGAKGDKMRTSAIVLTRQIDR